MIDLFDGKLQGTKTGNMVHFLEAVEGQAVDYDFTRDVGLIRIRPGRRLPACRVVPGHWEPQSRMQVLTVGCSEGHDATAWHTIITKAAHSELPVGKPDLRGDRMRRGSQAGAIRRRTVHRRRLHRRRLQFRRAPGKSRPVRHAPIDLQPARSQQPDGALRTGLAEPGTLMADGRTGNSPRRNGSVAIERAQSPDQEESPRSRPESDLVMIPAPNLLGIDPVADAPERTAQAASGTTRRTAWQPHPVAEAPVVQGSKAEQTDLKLDPAADHDHFSSPADAHDAQAAGDSSDSNAALLPVANSSSKWRPVKRAPAMELKN